MNTPRGAPDVVTFGETMALLTAAEVGPLRYARAFHLSIGGAESNLAVALARLGFRTTWCGGVGDDEFGHLVLERLRAEGVDVSRARVRPDAPTGLMIKERRTASMVRVSYYRGGSAASLLSPDDLDLGLIASARVLHLTGITPALSDSAAATVRAAIASARAAGTTTSLDLNYRSRLWDAGRAGQVLRELVAQSDIVFGTLAECGLLLEEPDPGGCAKSLAELGPSQAVVMLGAEGAVACVGGELIRRTAPRVREVDPVGAGDAFAAGYLVGLLEERPPPERLGLAVAMGAFAVTVSGDYEGLPTRAELEEFMEGAEGVNR